MLGKALISASLTGVFCAGFAWGLARIGPMLADGEILIASFVSGFLGSLFAHFVLGRGR
jgi:uncharacterized membrane protein YjjB (DUF3815 family)